MDNTWFLAALWTGLALVATLLAIWFKVSTALSEIVVGTVAQLVVVVLGLFLRPLPPRVPPTQAAVQPSR